jgi:hypothetical protein
MAEFYIEKSASETGEHIVHSSTCSSLPTTEKMMYLGAYSNANAPVNKASDWYSKVSTCPTCLAA